MDVVSDGEFIEAGAQIVVSRVDATASLCGASARQQKGVKNVRS